MEKIEFFDGIVNVNPLLFLLNIFVGLFVWFYIYHKYKTTGWLVDFWNVFLLFSFIIPVIILYPFCASKYNKSAISAFYDSMLNDIDYIYLLNITTIPFAFLGKQIFDSYFMNKKIIIVETYRQFVEKTISNKIVFYQLLMITLILLLYVIYVQIENKVLFNPRAFFHADNNIRPIYNATLFIFSLTNILAGLRILEKKSIENIIIFVVLCIVGVFLGARGAILGGLLSTIIIYFYLNYDKIKIKYIAIVFICFLLLIVGLQSLREKKLSFEKFNDIGFELAYGNSFSDLRDFAIVYSKWDKELLFGKTYFAGFIAFIPRSMSKFRDDWALGVFTVNTINTHDDIQIIENKLRPRKKNQSPGITTKNHPGMRPGTFGEMYFNFGFIGVLILALVIGFVSRYIDFNIKLICKSSKNAYTVYSFIFLFTLISCFQISVGFSNFYFLNFTLMGLSFTTSLIQKRSL